MEQDPRKATAKIPTEGLVKKEGMVTTPEGEEFWEKGKLILKVLPGGIIERYGENGELIKRTDMEGFEIPLQNPKKETVRIILPPKPSDTIKLPPLPPKPPEEKRPETKIFSTAYMEKSIRQILSKEESVKSIEDLTITGSQFELILNAKIIVKKYLMTSKITLKDAHIMSTGNELGVYGYILSATRAEDRIKALFEANILNVGAKLKEYIEKEEKRKVEKIEIIKGELVVTFSAPEIRKDPELAEEKLEKNRNDLTEDYTNRLKEMKKRREKITDLSSENEKSRFLTKRKLQVAALIAGLGIGGYGGKKAIDHLNYLKKHTPVKKVEQKAGAKKETRPIYKSPATNLTEEATRLREEGIRAEIKAKFDEELARKQIEIDTIKAKLVEAKIKAAKAAPVVQPKLAPKTREEVVAEIEMKIQKALAEGKDPNEAITADEASIHNWYIQQPKRK